MVKSLNVKGPKRMHSHGRRRTQSYCRKRGHQCYCGQLLHGRPDTKLRVQETLDCPRLDVRWFRRDASEPEKTSAHSREFRPASALKICTRKGVSAEEKKIRLTLQFMPLHR